MCLSTGHGSLWGSPLAYFLEAEHVGTHIHHQSICGGKLALRGHGLDVPLNGYVPR
jgi:hypothetical protein